MIRINLLPKKRRATRAGAASGRTSPGQWWIFAMLVLWIALGAVGYWLLSLEEEQVQSLRQQAAAQTKQAEVISKEIDEEALEARKREVEQAKTAIEKLEDKRRSPVYVMYELSMILTPKEDGGDIDIDKEKYNRLKADDPNNVVNERWDPTGLWLRSLVEKQGTLTIEGSARDASDLSEFTRRLRVSARFGRVSHPDFSRVDEKKDDDLPSSLEWKLDVSVARWD